MLAITREMEPVVGTGQRAILKLGSVLQDFLSPSAGAQKILTGLHVSLRDASGQFIGFGPAVDRIGTALSGVHSPAQRAADLVAIFGKNANIAAVLLAEGSAGLAANQKALLDQGTAAAGAATRNLDLGQKFAIARATVLTMTDAIGGALLPALTGVANVVLPVINRIGQWVTLNPQLASQILLVAGALGVLLYAITNLGPAIALLNLPLVLLIGAAVGLGVAWANNWGNIRGIVANAVSTISPLLSGLANAVLPALGQAITWLRVNVLPPLGDAFNAVAGWVRINWPLISSIVAQVAGAVRTAFLVIVNVIQFAWPILVGIGRVVFPIIGTAATILLNVLRGVFNVIGVIWQTAAITAGSVAKSIGDVWNGLAAIFRAVSAAIGAAIGVATGIITGLLGVVSTVAKAIGDFFGWLFGNANQAGAALKGLTPQGYPVVPPGGKYEGGIHPALVGATNLPGVNTATLSRTNVPVFQHGGMVGGVGPQLAVVHGGETVIPAGGGGNIILNHTSQLVVDGDVLAELVERRLFRNATNTLSGFGANPGVTGA